MNTSLVLAKLTKPNGEKRSRPHFEWYPSAPVALGAANREIKLTFESSARLQPRVTTRLTFKSTVETDALECLAGNDPGGGALTAHSFKNVPLVTPNRKDDLQTAFVGQALWTKRFMLNPFLGRRLERKCALCCQGEA